jgi:hypothetical protein
MAMAKQQQFYSEQQLQKQLQAAQAKRRPPPANGPYGSGFSGSQSLSGEGSTVIGSPQLQNAGAMVVRTMSAKQPPPDQPQRKLL